MSGRHTFATLAGFLLLISLGGKSAERERGRRPLGSIQVRGSVWVDKQLVPKVASLFPGDVVATGEGSGAMIDFQSGTFAILGEKTEVALSKEQSSTSLALGQGALRLFTPSNRPTQVKVLGASVTLQGQGNLPAISRIAYVEHTAVVLADRGHVEIHRAGAPLTLAPGMYALLEAGVPQGAGQKAGTVSGQIPRGVVQHSGQTVENPLQLNDAVLWEDLVRTLQAGRMRIALLDGSFLNIGARSTMRITRHDAQTQQTEAELTLGRLRGEVIKLTKPGGRFQLRTQTAVIGVVGTVFVVYALANLTRVICIEGILTVRNINPAVAGEVTVQAGESSTVRRGRPPTIPVVAPAGQVQREIALTNVGPSGPPTTPPAQPTERAGAAPTAPLGQAPGAPGAAPTAPGAVPPGGVPPAPAAPPRTPVPGGAVIRAGRAVPSTALPAVATSLAAVSAVLTGLAISRANDASESLVQAQSTLGQAQSTSTNAVAQVNATALAAISSLVANTTDLNAAIISGFQSVVSPFTPACRCQ